LNFEIHRRKKPQIKLGKTLTFVEGSEVKPWINEDIFKTWTDAQKRL